MIWQEAYYGLWVADSLRTQSKSHRAGQQLAKAELASAARGGTLQGQARALIDVIQKQRRDGTCCAGRWAVEDGNEEA